MVLNLSADQDFNRLVFFLARFRFIKVYIKCVYKRLVYDKYKNYLLILQKRKNGIIDDREINFAHENIGSLTAILIFHILDKYFFCGEILMY